MSRVAVLALALALPNLAAAAPKPGEAAAIVGGVSLGSAVVGGAALGAVGVFVTDCPPDAFECYGPILFGVVGGGVGWIAGGAIGAGVSADLLGGRGGRAAGWSLATSGIGLGLSVGGLVAESGGLMTAGGLVAGLGGPVAAGVAAGTDRAFVPSVSLAPELHDDYRGVRLAVRF